MSPLLIISLLLLVILSSLSNAKISPPKPKAFIFPIRKDATSNQYYTSIEIGSNATTLKLSIDLDGKFLWFNSPAYFSAAGSYRPIPCGSKECDAAEDFGCTNCSTTETPVPGCTDNTCSEYVVSPFTGDAFYGGLGQDVLRAYSTRGAAQFKLSNFPFQYTDPFLMRGLSTLVAGAVGLGQYKFSLTSQLWSNFKIRPKFALCVPPTGSDGNIIVGKEAYREPFQQISDSMLTTPLLTNKAISYGDDEYGIFSASYFVDVKSVRVGATALSLNKTLLSIDRETGAGGTSIRTARAYTALHSSIHAALVDEFVKAAAAMKVKRVAAVAPFAACFDPKTISSTKSGPHVPPVDLVLHSKKVFWRFYGSNLMVRVGGAMCLAVLELRHTDGDYRPKTAIVLGAYQLENHLLEFDVASSNFGFSSSLLLTDTSCKHFGPA